MSEHFEPEMNSTLAGLESPEAELVFALVYPVGTDYSGVSLALRNYVKRFRYQPQEIRVSEHIASRRTRRTTWRRAEQRTRGCQNSLLYGWRQQDA
jgi:hypothetical protein